MTQVKPTKPVAQKERAFDDKVYRRYLHTQQCRRCGKTTGCQAAHLGHARGTGYKESVSQCVPLCPDCHREFDTAAEGKEKWWMTQIVIPAAERAYAQWMETT